MHRLQPPQNTPLGSLIQLIAMTGGSSTLCLHNLHQHHKRQSINSLNSKLSHIPRMGITLSHRPIRNARKVVSVCQNSRGAHLHVCVTETFLKVSGVSVNQRPWVQQQWRLPYLESDAHAKNRKWHSGGPTGQVKAIHMTWEIPPRRRQCPPLATNGSQKINSAACICYESVCHVC